MPTNLYGPGDNFDLRDSHVVPALIRKFHEPGSAATRWSSGAPGAAARVPPRRRPRGRLPVPHASATTARPTQRRHGRGPDHPRAGRAGPRCRPPGGGSSSTPPSPTARRASCSTSAGCTPWAGGTGFRLREGIAATYRWFSRTPAGHPDGAESLGEHVADNERPAGADHRHHRQDGSYLAELLLGKGYEVYGIDPPLLDLQHRAHRPHLPGPARPDVRLILHYGDLNDASLAQPAPQDSSSPTRSTTSARSRHVGSRSTCPSTPPRSTGVGAVRLLEAMRELRRCSTRFYQASSSEMFGKAPEIPQSETTPVLSRAAPTLRPRSTPTASRVNYREAYGMFAVQRHPLQPRVAAPRRDLRDAQDHPRRRPHQARPPGAALPRQPRRQARLGLRRRLRRSDVAHAAARTSRTTTSIATGERRTASASSASCRFAARASIPSGRVPAGMKRASTRVPASSGSRSTRPISGPRRSRISAATPRAPATGSDGRRVCRSTNWST